MTERTPSTDACPYPGCQDVRTHPRPHLIEAAFIDKRIREAESSLRARLAAEVRDLPQHWIHGQEFDCSLGEYGPACPDHVYTSLPPMLELAAVLDLISEPS